MIRVSRRLSRLAFSALLSIPLALLALAPLAAPVAAHPVHPAAPLGPHGAPSGELAMDVTLHYHATAIGTPYPVFMATDAQGDLYISDFTSDRVVMLDPNDNFVRFFGTGTIGTGNGDFENPDGVAVSGNTVFVADYGNHRIQTFDKSTGNYMGQFGASNLAEPFGIAFGSNGQLYVVDQSSNHIAEFSTGGTYLGSFGSAGSNNGQFNTPWAIAASPLGFLYVTEVGNHRVQQFNLAGTYLGQWGATSFQVPRGIAVDRAGMIYVMDETANTLYKFDPSGFLVGTYAAPPTTPFIPGTFDDPIGVTVRSIPNTPLAVYVSDIGAHNVQRFDQLINPQYHTYQAQWGSAGSGNGQFNTPWASAVDSAGNVYVVDALNNRVEKFDQFGNFLLAFGGAGSGNGQFSFPTGIALSPPGDPDGTTVFVADAFNNRIEEFNTSGGYIRQFGGAGSGNGQFSTPQGLATDFGTVYVADSGNNRIQVFDALGDYEGQFGSYGSGDTNFNVPTGIALDINRQELFISDVDNNRVQVYSAQGSFVTSLTSANGTHLSGPEGVATDQRGDVYIADSNNNRIVQMDVNTTVASSFGTAGSGNGQFSAPFAIAVSPTSGQIFIVDKGNSRVERFGSPWPKHDTGGIYRPSTKTFYLRNENSTGPAEIIVPMPYAQSGDLPVVGDWNGDGVDTVGLYRTSTGNFFLQDANVQENAPDYVFTLGVPGDTPIAGDWNGDGSTSAGIFRPSNGILYLKNGLSTGPADDNLVLGVPGDKGIAGDWNGDGQDSPGVYRPSNQRFYVTNKVTDGVVYSDASAILGISGDAPFTGDWVAQGSSGIGVFRPTNGITYEKNTIVTGPADNHFVYGSAGDYPVAGQWVAPSVPFTAPVPHVSLGTHSSASSHPASGGYWPASPAGTPARATAPGPRNKPSGAR